MLKCVHHALDTPPNLVHTYCMQGTCAAMCSSAEARERDRLGDVSIYEATPETRGLLRSTQRRIDVARAVKKYRRAADGRWEGPEEVRTLQALEDTVAHLWLLGAEELAATREEKHVLQLYEFLADRLQAVRKDLVVQVRSYACMYVCTHA